MEATRRIARSDLGDLCPLTLLGDFLEDVAEATAPFDEPEHPDDSVTTTARRTVANVLRANAALLDELAGITFGRRARPTTAPASDVRPHRASAARALVLAGTPGSTVVGEFAVENARAVPVDIAAAIEPFVDAAGTVIVVDARFDPEKVLLDPGANGIVRLYARIPDEVVAAGELTSAITVPGLSGMTVPVTLRIASPAP
jgi:hypothetical protein